MLPDWYMDMEQEPLYQLLLNLGPLCLMHPAGNKLEKL